jgi:predicted GH43/DUF377 family glycosyl hydrolase
MMKWKKLGLVYYPDGHLWWAKTHAMIPTPDIINDKIIRIYITLCDAGGIGRVGYVDVDSNDPKEILNVSQNPVLDIGVPGTFDENGVLQCSIVNLPDGRKFLYYVGFELGTKIRYRLLSGLAISDDGGISFQRTKQTPVLERASKELFFRGGPFCSFDADRFRMWYVAGSSWMEIDGKMMPVYTINYLESPDGIRWGKEGKVCIDVEHEDEYGFGRPYVIKEDGFYRMFYSIRKKHIGYRLGYAESEDGISWIRKDDEVGIDVSESGWDSETICYSAVLKVKDKVYMFYNGNEFGKTGFGYAVLESWD